MSQPACPANSAGLRDNRGLQRTQRGTIGGCVSRVDAKSLGERLGIRRGDVLLSVNGQLLRDEIDFRYHSAEPQVEMVLRRADSTLTLLAERRFGESLGIEFAHPTFDVDIRRCANRCEFCFVAQMPQGMRGALYVKDDDYRYSFLFGQFVTLTNLTDKDWQRIEEQHLSPLYVSVHATEPEVRRRLLGRSDAPDVLAQLSWLAERHMCVHTQLVLVPGHNDGVHLERSLSDLMGLYPGVQSVSVVPVGLTRWHAPGLRPYRPEEARHVLDQVAPWRARCRRAFDLTFVYPSDEWYLLAGRPIPSAAEYDHFGQLENGVGIVRQFLDDWDRIRARLADGRSATGAVRRYPPCAPPPCENRGPLLSGRSERTSQSRCVQRASAVCGELAAPVVEPVVTEMNGLLGTQLEVRPVANRWYGGAVTVSGLLTGHDVIEQLRAGRPLGDLVLLPRVMFDAAGQVTLDDMTLEQIQAGLGVAATMVQGPGEVVEALVGAGISGSAGRVTHSPI